MGCEDDDIGEKASPEEEENRDFRAQGVDMKVDALIESLVAGRRNGNLDEVIERNMLAIPVEEIRAIGVRFKERAPLEFGSEKTGTTKTLSIAWPPDSDPPDNDDTP